MNSRHTGSNAPAQSRVAAFSAAFKVSRAARAVAASLPLLAASAAFAQDAADAPGQQVVITAARASQKLPDTLPSTSVISRSDIDASPAIDLPDLLRTFTSFNVAQTGPRGSQTSVFVRGANSNQVLVLVDGAPLSRADFGSAPWELVPLAQIDHVEIVRGNLSSLYGAQAVGGVVQIFTKRGGGTSVSLSAGNKGTLQGNGFIGRRFGDALEPLDISASISSSHTHGYSARDSKTDASADPDRDPSEKEGATFAIAKTWAPGQRTSFSVLHSDTTSHYDGYEADFGDDVLKTKLDSIALKSHHEITGNFSIDLDAGQTLDHYVDPTGFTPEGHANTLLLGVGGDWTVAPGQVLQFGYENQGEHYDDSFTPEILRRTNSFRAGYLGTFGSAFEVQANVRHDKADDYGSATTGLLSLGWRLSPEWKLVAQGSTAFSAPSFSSIQYEDHDHPLKAEHSRDLELGVHWQHAGWLARATVFSQRQHDLVAFTPTFQTVNIAHATNRGVELSVDGDTGYGKLGLDATFQRPHDEDTHAALSRRARTVVAANYRVPVYGWETGVWLHYTGARPDLDPVSFATVQAKARTSLGLSTQHALTPNWTLGLKVDNITGTHTPEVLGYTPPPTTALVTLSGQWQ
jgi:vitamin B12 transporter